MYVSAYVYAGALRDQKRVGPLELGLQAVCEAPVWVLRTEAQSSGRAASALHS